MSISSPPPLSDQAKPLAAYSPARLVSIGPTKALLYISGTTARAVDGSVPPFDHVYDESLALGAGNEGVEPLSAASIQIDVILSKMDEVIRSASKGNAGLDALVEMTIFVKDLKRDCASINAAYNDTIGKLFSQSGLQPPARTCVQVSAMPPDERTLVEVKGIAEITISQD